MCQTVRRYLYLMDSEIGATATTEILNVLSEEGLVKLDHKTGEYRLTCRESQLKPDPCFSLNA